MEVLIRRATSDDSPVIADLYSVLDALHVQAHPDRFAPSSRAAEEFDAQQDGRAIFVAQLGRGVVGFADLRLRPSPEHPVRKPRLTGVIDGLVVDPAARRRGIGRLLLQASEEWLGEMDVEGVELNVYAFNDDAKRFYESCGYAPLLVRLVKAS